MEYTGSPSEGGSGEAAAAGPAQTAGGGWAAEGGGLAGPSVEAGGGAGAEFLLAAEAAEGGTSPVKPVAPMPPSWDPVGTYPSYCSPVKMEPYGFPDPQAQALTLTREKLQARPGASTPPWASGTGPLTLAAWTRRLRP